MKPQNLKLVLYLLTAVPAAFCLLGLTGCGTTPKPTRWNLQVSANTKAAIRLDVVGINLMDKQDWAATSVDDYWKPNNPMRASADRLSFEIVDGTIKCVGTTVAGADQGLGGSNPNRVVVPITNKVWDKWKARNVVGLVVVGDFPGTPTTPDRRKQVVPLYKEYWDSKDHSLQFEIQDGRVQVVTPPSAKAGRIVF